MLSRLTIKMGFLVLLAPLACSDNETGDNGAEDTGASSSANSSSSGGRDASSASSSSSSSGEGGSGGAVGGTGGAGGAGAGAVVVINEVNADDPVANAWVEFYNAGNADAYIGYWYFTDGDSTHVYEFPMGTFLPAGEYLVVGAATYGFGLSNWIGDGVHLFDAQGAAIDQTGWAANQIPAPNSWARLPNGTGAFQVDATPTKGAENN
jgi:hypothetical protein